MEFRREKGTRADRNKETKLIIEAGEKAGYDFSGIETKMVDKFGAQQAQQAIKQNAAVAQQVALVVSKQALTNGIGMIGATTGDYVTQERIQTLTNVLYSAGMLATGNPIAIASTVVSIGSNLASGYIEMKKNDYNAEILRQRVGLANSRGR